MFHAPNEAAILLDGSWNQVPPCLSLILVRHSLPEIVPEVPATQWHLSITGRRRCMLLAQRVSPYQPQVIVSSHEAKAVETAQIVADQLDLPMHFLDGLEEHHRENIAYTTRQDFKRQVGRFFKIPSELVFGSETADQAVERFSQTISMVIDDYPEKSIAVVTHGTVISLFAWRSAGVNPYQFWQDLGLPAYAVLPLPDMDRVVGLENFL